MGQAQEAGVRVNGIRSLRNRRNLCEGVSKTFCAHLSPMKGGTYSQITCCAAASTWVLGRRAWAPTLTILGRGCLKDKRFAFLVRRRKAAEEMYGGRRYSHQPRPRGQNQSKAKRAATEEALFTAISGGKVRDGEGEMSICRDEAGELMTRAQSERGYSWLVMCAIPGVVCVCSPDCTQT